MLEIVVADNDEAREGVSVCESLPENYPFNVIALSNSSSGISGVRNAVANKALSLQPEIVAFLDDDEIPEPQWLSELLRIQAQHNADVVGGPTKPLFPAHAPAELLDNPYFGADLCLPDGSACQLQAGGNFLIRASVLQHYAPSVFKEAFAHSGGEDLAFFSQIGQDGYRMRWAANAIVHEPVPESRLAPDWLKHRVLTIHNSRVRVMQYLQPSLPAAAMRLLKTFALASVAGIMSLSALILPRYRQQAQLLRWKFMGKLTAHLGQISTRVETN